MKVKEIPKVYIQEPLAVIESSKRVDLLGITGLIIAGVGLMIAGLSLWFSIRAVNNAKEAFMIQNMPILQIEDFEVGDRKDETLSYKIKNLSINPAQLIYVEHSVVFEYTRPTIDHNSIKIFPGRKVFRPPIRSRYIPTYLQSVFVVQGTPIKASLNASALRNTKYKSYYFMGKFYFIDQITDRCRVFSFVINFSINEDGSISHQFIRNDNKEFNNENALNSTEPNGDFDWNGQ